MRDMAVSQRWLVDSFFTNTLPISSLRICTPVRPPARGLGRDLGENNEAIPSHFSNRGQTQVQSDILRVKFSVDTLL